LEELRKYLKYLAVYGFQVGGLRQVFPNTRQI